MTHEAIIFHQPAGVARQLVLLFHGLGADAEDLRPVGERFASADLDDARRIERVAALSGRYARLPDEAPAGTTLFFVHGKADDVVHCG